MPSKETVTEIKSVATDSQDKPAFPTRLFWDFRYDEIEWRNDYVTVIERVLEWGNDEEWQELLRFFGRYKVVDTLKFESTHLMDHTIEKVCKYFNMRPEELRCYTRKRLRGGHWL